MRTVVSTLLMALVTAVPALAGTLEGLVTDRSGAVLPGATILVQHVATGAERLEPTGQDGRFVLSALPVGVYRVVASLSGFSDASRSLVVLTADQVTTMNFVLEIGTFRAEVTVAADRGTRDMQGVPLRADTLTARTLRELTPTSTGEAIVSAPGVTPVGSGPFQMRPRLRGLDSTRVLVLVDGERLNNARTATDRAGIEVGLVDSDSIEAVEVLGGAGSVLYGTDALSGTINIITNRPQLSDTNVFTAGAKGFFSTNDDGRRGSVSLGFSSPRLAISFTGGVERFNDYSAGGDFGESSEPLFADGTLHQDDTIDDGFGFEFGAFPDPFNAPFTRTAATVANSGMSGSSANLAGIVRLSPTRQVEFRYQRRRAEDVGFPDFDEPTFFQRITLPESEFEKVSATYTATDVTPWLSRLSATTYYQRHDRLLRNDFPVQFPAPTPLFFFPIDVFRLDILSDTRQRVWTPGVEVQATVLTRPDNVLTVGTTIFRDRSEDDRTTTTQMSLVGEVDIGPFGPSVGRPPFPIPLGAPVVEHPTRVPNASFRDAGFFVHDEWTPSADLRLTGGVRIDSYRVTTDATPGYDIESLIEGAEPAIDPDTLPDIAGDRISRTALTGEAGVVVRPDAPVSYFLHYVRSYRHPNLEELLFSGPATTGNIVPNITVEPETGHNIDVGARVRLGGFVGAVSYFNNTYSNFISTEVVAELGRDSVSQAINLARVRIQGVELEGTAPILAGGLTWLPAASFAYNRGTVLEGTTPLEGTSLAGAPQDNITPWKLHASLRVSDRGERWWASYSVRSQGEVTRISPLLSESPFLIAQDLFALEGFSLHRAAVGYDWRSGSQQMGVTLAVDNLTDRFYRDHFQFAPGRGRSLSLLVTIGGRR